MTPNTPRPQPVSATQLVWALLAIAFVTAVLPPAAAWSLNAYRVAQTAERAGAAAARLKSGGAVPAPDLGVVCGPGRLPAPPPAARGGVPIDTHLTWLQDAKRAPALFGAGMPTDAWGRCFLMNHNWLLSAGPNGLVETSTDASVLSGDDIGFAVR